MCKRVVIIVSAAPQEAVAGKGGQGEDQMSPYCYHLSSKQSTSIDVQCVIFETGLKARSQFSVNPCRGRYDNLWTQQYSAGICP